MPLNHISDLTEKQYEVLGKLLVEWSNIEILLAEILGRLLITPSLLARTYLRRMTAHEIQEALYDALDIHKRRYKCKLVDHDLLEEIGNLNKEAVSIRSFRNKFAHSIWTRIDDERIYGTSFSGKLPVPKKKNKYSYSYTIDELKAFHTQSYQIVDRLTAVIGFLPELKEEKISEKLNFPK